MSKTPKQILKGATVAQRRKLVLSLRAAISAQVLLWNQQQALGRALGELMGPSGLSDEEDTAVCGMLHDFAVGWDTQVITDVELEALVERVLKASGV